MKYSKTAKTILNIIDTYHSLIIAQNKDINYKNGYFSATKVALNAILNNTTEKERHQQQYYRQAVEYFNNYGGNLNIKDQNMIKNNIQTILSHTAA